MPQRCALRHRRLKPLSLVTFFAAAKKVTAAPHRGNANKPKPKSGCHQENQAASSRLPQRKPKPNTKKSPPTPPPKPIKQKPSSIHPNLSTIDPHSRQLRRAL